MTTVAKHASSITQTSAISASNTPAVFYANVPVVTTGMLGGFYGTEAANIKKNYSRNSARFIEGKHYFLIQGNELKEFKNSVTESHQVDKRTPKLILWTERGAARHAKMLETDQAWEVFEQLEDCYFSVKAEVAKQPKPRKSSSDERTPLRQYVEKMIANKSGMKYPEIWDLVHERFDVQHINQLSATEALEAVEYLKTIEGEFLGKQQELPKPELSINYPLEWFEQNSGYTAFKQMTINGQRAILTADMLVEAPSPALRLFNHLRDNGYDITAPYMEIQALRHIMIKLRWSLSEIQRTAKIRESAALTFRL